MHRNSCKQFIQSPNTSVQRVHFWLPDKASEDRFFWYRSLYRHDCNLATFGKLPTDTVANYGVQLPLKLQMIIFTVRNETNKIQCFDK